MILNDTISDKGSSVKNNTNHKQKRKYAVSLFFRMIKGTIPNANANNFVPESGDITAKR